MKKRSLVIFVAAFIFAMFFRESRAQDAFPLYCRGGETMKFMAHKGDVQGTYNILGMSFQKAPGPSGKEGKKLAPGQCSWGDMGSIITSRIFFKRRFEPVLAPPSGPRI